MDKCSVCMRTVAEENKIHAFTEDGEGCCKTCWDWLKENIQLCVDEDEKQS